MVKDFVVAGMVDVTDFVNVYALASPWTGFMNFAFSTGSAAMFIPNEDSFGPDLDDQYTFEVYYRLQVTEQFALTPDIQYLVDPAQNPTEDSLWIFGLRARMAL